MTKQPETMADRVLNGRQARGLTQQRLADLAGISVSAVSRLEQLNTSSLETLEAIAPHLQTTVDFLRNGVPTERRARRA